MRIHATCVARGGQGILLRGPSGSGKSDLALRLLARGFALVADDQVELDGLDARPPVALAGLIELRGVGVLRIAHEAPARVALILELGEAAPRMPAPARDPVLDVTLLRFDPWQAAAAEKAAFALDAALGLVACVGGAFS